MLTRFRFTVKLKIKAKMCLSSGKDIFCSTQAWLTEIQRNITCSSDNISFSCWVRIGKLYPCKNFDTSPINESTTGNITCIHPRTCHPECINLLLCSNIHIIIFFLNPLNTPLCSHFEIVTLFSNYTMCISWSERPKHLCFFPAFFFFGVKLYSCHTHTYTNMHARRIISHLARTLTLTQLRSVHQ